MTASGSGGQLQLGTCLGGDSDQPVPGVGDSATLTTKCGLVVVKGDAVLTLIGYGPYMGDRAADILGGLAKLALGRI